MRTPLVAGNWKMHGTLASGRALVGALLTGLADRDDGPEVLICPAFPHLALIAETLDGGPLVLGAQDLSDQPGEGAFTGDVGGAMLVDIGCAYVLVGSFGTPQHPRRIRCSSWRTSSPVPRRPG